MPPRIAAIAGKLKGTVFDIDDSLVIGRETAANLCIADANTIAMLEQPILDGNVVNERAVKTLQISDYKSRFVFFDLRMAARH